MLQLSNIHHTFHKGEVNEVAVLRGVDLHQLGLLDAATLPVAGVESAQKALDPHAVPSNALIKRAGK